MTDAFHSMFICLCLATSLGAIYFSEKKANLAYSYGYERYEVLAAFSNSTFLIFVAAFLLVEATHRVYEPPRVQSEHLVWVSGLGLLLDLYGTCCWCWCWCCLCALDFWIDVVWWWFVGSSLCL